MQKKIFKINSEVIHKALCNKIERHYSWFAYTHFNVRYFGVYTQCLKTSHIRIAITVTHMNRFWYFFGWNLTDKVGNQKTLYATANNLCFCTTWQNGKTRKSYFSLKCCISRERCSSWVVLHTECTSALSSWKQNCHLSCVW